ncbi:MAG: lipocalin-like domain-containing protein [Acidobacteriota bacterium]
MYTRLFSIAFLLFGSIIGATTQISPKGLVGTWQLVSRIDRDPAGQVLAEPSIGSDPLGYLIYDSKGHVAAQLMARNRTSAPCATTAAADVNNVAHIGGYDAYFGRYEVDMRTGTVTHILDGALSPGDVGRRITRRFRLEGDMLTIQFEPGGQGNKRITRTLIWRRISP